jgi:uncharacterized protein (DUF1800 family)
MSLEGAIAANRFGLGARPGEIARAGGNPKAWLMDQLNGPAPQPAPLDGKPFANAGALVAEEQAYKLDRFMHKGGKDKAARKLARLDKKEQKASGAAPMADQAMSGQDAMDDASPKEPKQGGGNIRKQEYGEEMEARLALGFSTDRPFAERLARFWSNHFTVSAAHHKTLMFLGDYEREAIRPNINGSFEDMLFAVCMHPAMQVYLDNWRSIGPSSMAAKRSGKGLNENLGRELMELYTLGVDGGYTQADVIAMAKLLTGWSVYEGHPNGFGYYDMRHEPGPITLRGKTYPAGWDGSVAAIKDLAHDPATARHISTKLAAHFIADAPPADSVARLEKTFKDTGGNLHALSETLVKDPNAWHPQPKKMRTPVEFLTASMRVVGWPLLRDDERKVKQLRRSLAAVKLMGEVPFAAPSPKGWPDESYAWSGADGLMDRIEWAKDFGAALGPSANAAALAETGLGPLLRPETKSVMAKAGSPGEAVALLLVSPEFQRR